MRRIIFTALVFLALSQQGFAASRFWVGGTGNWDAVTTTHWSATSGGAGGASVPSSSDTVTFDTASNATAYTVTVTATANCSNLTIGNPLAGSLTFTGSSAVNISGNLSIASGVTRTYTGSLNFNATSGTKTITTNGVTLDNITFNGAGGTFQLVDNLTLTLNSSAVMRFLGGTFDGTTNSTTVTMNANTTGITVSGGTGTFYNLNIVPTTPTKNDNFSLSGDITVSNTFTVDEGATVTNRLFIKSTAIGTPRTITAASLSINNSDFQDIIGAGAASWNLSAITGLSGDCGGNSGITFTTPTTQHWTNASSGTWSTASNWTSRVPLPQDTVLMDKAFGTSQTVTKDMPRSGSIDWTGATWTTALTINNSAQPVYCGSLTLISGLTVSGGSSWSFIGRGNSTLDTKGISLSSVNLTLNTGNNLGTTTLLSDIVLASFSVSSGTFDTSTFNVTANSMTSTTGSVWDMGSGLHIFNNSGSVVQVNGNTVPRTSTIKLANQTANALTFSTAGRTFNNVWFDRGASTSTITIIGSNTFNTFRDSGFAVHSLLFTATTTNTFTNFYVSGTINNLITIGSAQVGRHDLVLTGGGVVNVKFVSISRSSTTPLTSWYAGTQSTDGGSNTGWIFANPQPHVSIWKYIKMLASYFKIQ